MRRWAQLVSLLVSVSFVLAPLSHVHAHVTGDAHTHVNVHGGHDHGISADHDDHHATVGDHDGGESHNRESHDHDRPSTHVLDMQPDASPRNSDQFDFIQWIAIAFVVSLVLFERMPVRLRLPPPRIRARPPSPYPHALPLLRGPPTSI
jgi:hypothetical protein